MSTDNLALLFRLKGDASQLRTATAEARQAINQLKQSFGPELAQTVSATNKAFSGVGVGIADLTQRIPIVGNAVSRLTSLLSSAGVESKTAEKTLASVANSIGNIAKESGRSIPQVAQFLTRFTQIAGAAERDSAAVEFFGASLATKLTPELAKARVALSAATAESAAAGTGIAGLAIPIGAAVIAVAALVAGLALVSRELFNVTRTAADFQGKMQDLSQQTGLAVETLSALEVAVTTTGGSLNSVTQAIVQFQRQMDDAGDSSSRAAKNFERIGVTVTDLDTTLRDTLEAIARMPAGFQQTNAAAELFGSRGGKQVLALLKETNGDLDAFQRKLQEAGILITTDAAQAADEFNDELALLHFQIRSLGAVIAKDLIPPMTELLEATGELVRAAKPLLSVIGSLAGVTVKSAANALRGLSTVVQLLTFDYQGLARSIKEAREEAEQRIPTQSVPDVTAPPLTQPNARERANEQIRLEEEVLAAAKRRAQVVNQQLQESFERGRIDAKQRAEETIANNRVVLERDRQLFIAQREAEEAHYKKIQARRDLAESERQEKLRESAGKIQAIKEKERDAETLFETTSREIRLRAAKQNADSRRAEEDNRTNILTKEYDRQIAAIQARIAREEQAEESGLSIIEQLERAKIEARREGLEQQKAIGLLTVEEQRSINRQIQQLDQDADRLREEQEQRRLARRIALAEGEARRLSELALSTADAINSAAQISDEARIARIRAFAALRIKTEEQAEREILQVRLDALAREDELARLRRAAAEAEIETRIKLIQEQRRQLNAELEKAGSIQDPARRATEQTRITAELTKNIDAEIALQTKANKERERLDQELENQLRIHRAQRQAITEQGNRDIDDARQQDLNNERDYADELRELQERVIDAQRDAAEEVIRLMIASGARRKDIIRAERDLEIQEEEDRHRRNTEAIRERQRTTDEEIRILEQRLKSLKIGTTEEIEEYERIIAALERLRQKRAELDAQQEAEGARSQTRTETINVETNLELADPDTGLKDVFDAIGESVAGLGQKFAELIGLGEEFSAISAQIAQQIGGALAGAFNQFANALGQTVANWALLGETGPAVMRKILAQALASLAAEAAVQAIKELALGFATLFFNPAESAAHFTAAGLWAAVGGGAALAGRSIAGDLFKPKSGTSGGTGAGSSRSGSRDDVRPIDLTRPRVDEIHVYFHPEPGARFNDHVVRAVVDDVQRNGPARDVIQRTAGG